MSPAKKWRELRRNLRRAMTPRDYDLAKRALDAHEATMTPKQLAQVRAEEAA